jgi:hypothetical protein
MQTWRGKSLKETWSQIVRIILKGNLKKSNMSVWAGCSWFRRKISAFDFLTRNEQDPKQKGNILISWAKTSVQKGLCLVELFHFYVILTEPNAVLRLAHLGAWILLSIFICFHPEKRRHIFLRNIDNHLHGVTSHEHGLYFLYFRVFISFHFYSRSKPRFG